MNPVSVLLDWVMPGRGIARKARAWESAWREETLELEDLSYEQLFLVEERAMDFVDGPFWKACSDELHSRKVRRATERPERLRDFVEASRSIDAEAERIAHRYRN